MRGRDESATDWVALTVRDRRVESHPLRQLLLADFVGAVEPGAADDMPGRESSVSARVNLSVSSGGWPEFQLAVSLRASV